MPTRVSELEVLIATSLWLYEHNWQIDSISIATGAGLPPIERQKEVVLQEFRSAHIPFAIKTLFNHRGPDIVARSDELVWKFECKGISLAKPQTHRNNFDRAVASVVSYYDAQRPRLGLALANDYLWQYHFGDRLPIALRQATDLWVILVENGKAYAYPPDDYLPYPGAND
jgi:hypothetical protein